MPRYNRLKSWGKFFYLVARFAEFAVIMAIVFCVIPDKHENLWGCLFGWAALWGAVYFLERVFRRWRTHVPF